MILICHEVDKENFAREQNINVLTDKLVGCRNDKACIFIDTFKRVDIEILTSLPNILEHYILKAILKLLDSFYKRVTNDLQPPRWSFGGMFTSIA